MTSSFTISDSETFSITHARHLGAKVATDLKRIQRLYGNSHLSDARIAAFEAEIIALLKAGYLGEVTYGFKKDGMWIEPTLHYTARELAGAAANDDDPGRVRPGADISGASFGSFLTYSYAWHLLSSDEKQKFESSLPLQRGNGTKPVVSGYFVADRTYSSGGRALDRQIVRSF